jgi:hypothetical protein
MTDRAADRAELGHNGPIRRPHRRIRSQDVGGGLVTTLALAIGLALAAGVTLG